jgi:ABC-2 type transport system permease protein
MTSFTRGISDDVFDTYLSIRFEWKKYLRSRRLVIITLLTIAVPLFVYVIPEITDVNIQVNTLVITNLGFLSVLIVISAALFTGDAISGEFERKTGLLLFPTAQRRSSIFIGKYLASMTAVFFTVTLYTVVVMLTIIVAYGVSDVRSDLGEAFLIALLFSTSAVSVVFFFSSILKSTISSTILGLVVLMILLPAIQGILEIVDVEPWFVVNYYSSLMITEGYSSTGGAGVASWLVEAFLSSDFAPNLYVGIGVMSAYSILFLIFGLVIANNRPMD